jgi:hypothetical protein
MMKLLPPMQESNSPPNIGPTIVSTEKIAVLRERVADHGPWYEARYQRNAHALLHSRIDREPASQKCDESRFRAIVQNQKREQQPSRGERQAGGDEPFFAKGADEGQAPKDHDADE